MVFKKRHLKVKIYQMWKNTPAPAAVRSFSFATRRAAWGVRDRSQKLHSHRESDFNPKQSEKPCLEILWILVARQKNCGASRQSRMQAVYATVSLSQHSSLGCSMSVLYTVKLQLMLYLFQTQNEACHIRVGTLNCLHKTLDQHSAFVYCCCLFKPVCAERVRGSEREKKRASERARARSAVLAIS